MDQKLYKYQSNCTMYLSFFFFFFFLLSLSLSLFTFDLNKMDYSNILYYNQFITANINNNNNNQLMANYDYYNNTNSNQHSQYQHLQNNTVNKQDLIPIFQYYDYSNLLQDDDFSIVSYNVPEFTPVITENIDYNVQYYQSNLSPQLSECCSSASSNSYNNMYYNQSDPVFIDSLFPSVIESDSNKEKRKTTTLADKRHICPVCSHRYMIQIKLALPSFY